MTAPPSMREQFEAWVKTLGPVDVSGEILMGSWRYNSQWAQMRWEAWQASAASMAEQAAKVEWGLIETAPDSLEVFLLADAEGNVGQGHRSRNSATGWVFQVTYWEVTPTHWSYMPKHPRSLKP